MAIFDEKVKVDAKPRIDANNTDYVRQGGNKKVSEFNGYFLSKISYPKLNKTFKIFEEKLKIDAKPRIDAYNSDYTKSGGNVKIFDEKTRIDARSRIDSIRPDYKPSGGDVKVDNSMSNFISLKNSAN